MNIPEFDQTPGDILQEQHEERVPPISVSVTDSVRTQDLPAKRATFFTVPVTALVGVQLLGRDPRRKHATVIGISEDIMLGSTQANALNGARIPSVVPFVITSVDEVWAVSVEDTTNISVICEYWSD